jgi:Carbohydrate binding domain
MKKLLLCCCLFLSVGVARADEPLRDRFVWIFGWNLTRNDDVGEISQVLETAGRHGLNGAVASFGLDTLCQKSPQYFSRLEQVKQACARSKLELIPAVFSVGYGGGILAHDRNLAEGLPVVNAPFLVQGGKARLVVSGSSLLANGGFEEFHDHHFARFSFHDQPGEISFADTQIHHGGKASIRLENFTANPHGHGRVMQEIHVQPHRCYRVSLWVKTAGLEPGGAFQVLARAGDRDLAPRTFHVPATSDWRKLSYLFNSLDESRVNLYAGVWGGKSGRFWIDDWRVEEVGPLNVLHRPGTPVSVRDVQGKTTYAEGKDYAPLVDSHFSFGRVDREAASMTILPGSRIKEGEHIQVGWYHPMIIHDSQQTVCMAEPALYEIFDHEARLLAERLHPKHVLLNMDEIRMGGTCAACRGRNMGELLGDCISRQVQSLRRYMPGVEVLIWSDMLDPHHNAHGNYYLVAGDFTGSWRHVPKDLVMAVWGGEPREKNIRFFSELGFRTLGACYYDADDLAEVKGWLDLVRRTPKAQGLMYTPWLRKYALLGEFGDLLRKR